MEFLWILFGVLVFVWMFTILQSLIKKSPISDEARMKHIALPVQLGKFAGCKSIQGQRPHMEDTYQSVTGICDGDATSAFFAVFDGHGGSQTSKFAASHLHRLVNSYMAGGSTKDTKEALQKACLQLDAEWLVLAAKGNYDDGSTAIVAVVESNVLTVCNLGDSRCVLSSGGRAVDMSHDHKPIREDEKQRILDLGGRVIYYGTWRVEGILAVSRAFGDRRLKKFVTAEPEIKSRELQEQDDFLILASDGVWDVLSSQAAVDIVSKASTPQQAAALLTDAAYSRGSLDNITSLVIDLRYFAQR